jgi:tetraacyldisaccharide-1-P 4'-kinase
MGVALAGRLSFPDHHDYSADDVRRIRKAAAGRTIVTTEKDAVKLQGLVEREDVRVLGQRVTIEGDEQELVGSIAQVLR